MIISLHIGKTAGVSFCQALKNTFQSDYYADYVDTTYFNESYFYEKKLPSSLISPRIDDNIKIIHGHMLLAKWLPVYPTAEHTYITWLRHPLKRLASNFNFFHHLYIANPHNKNDRVWEIIHDKWTFEQYCFSEVYRNYMHQYLCGVPLEDFKFVGITEFFNEDFTYFFSKYCNVEIAAPYANKTSVSLPEVESLVNDSNFAEKVQEFHAKDYDLYNRALDRRGKERD